MKFASYTEQSTPVMDVLSVWNHQINNKMEKSTKILVALGLGALAYWYFNKKKATKPTTALKTTEPLPTSDGTTHKYPVGAILSSNQTGNVPTGEKVQLKEGDAIKGIPETVYVLKDGEKHPVTGKWWIYNYGEDWSNLIQLSDTTVDLIPTGATFTINGE